MNFQVSKFNSQQSVIPCFEKNHLENQAKSVNQLTNSNLNKNFENRKKEERKRIENARVGFQRSFGCYLNMKL